MAPAPTPSSGFWLQLWRRLLSAADLMSADGQRAGSRWIPIRSLAVRHKPRILKHLQALAPQDRYLRFGYPATDEQIERYVSGLNFVRDEIFGVFNRRLELVAMAHLGVSPRDVVGELARREGLSGLEEFAARSKPAAGPQGA